MFCCSAWSLVPSKRTHIVRTSTSIVVSYCRNMLRLVCGCSWAHDGACCITIPGLLGIQHMASLLYHDPLISPADLLLDTGWITPINMINTLSTLLLGKTCYITLLSAVVLRTKIHSFTKHGSTTHLAQALSVIAFFLQTGSTRLYAPCELEFHTMFVWYE